MWEGEIRREGGKEMDMGGWEEGTGGGEVGTGKVGREREGRTEGVGRGGGE